MKLRDEYIGAFQSGEMDRELSSVSISSISSARNRYMGLLTKLNENIETYIFSTPGRTELAGNHTDHNNGLVLAAAVNLDTVAAVQKRSDNVIYLESEGFSEKFIVDLTVLSPQEGEKGSTSGLIRGVAAALKMRGYTIGGFTAYVDSTIPPGSGLSSSASFEILIATILNTLYNDGHAGTIDLAAAAQYAENTFFGKPSGLMDQLACAVGGIVCIDFENKHSPMIEPVEFSLSDYSIMIVKTGGSHADLTDEYASIPNEMKNAAQLLGKESCREISEDDFLQKINHIRSELSDRHVLRVLHYLEENRRVKEILTAIENTDVSSYLALIQESGSSSCKYLQNCYSIGNPGEQGISLALGLTEKYLHQSQCAFRVHGGGFAGTIQVYVPDEYKTGYAEFIDGIFGTGSAMEIKIRETGSYCFQ